MKYNFIKTKVVLAYCAAFSAIAFLAGSHLWAADTQHNNQRQASVASTQSQAPNLSSRIGKKCVVFYSPAQTTYEEGVLIAVSDKWVVISKPYGEESIEHWFPMASVHYISFVNLKPAK